MYAEERRLILRNAWGAAGHYRIKCAPLSRFKEETARAVVSRMKPLSLYHPALYWLRVWQKKTVPPDCLALFQQALRTPRRRSRASAISLPQTHLETHPQTRRLRPRPATQQSHQPQNRRRRYRQRHHRPRRTLLLLPPRRPPDFEARLR